MNITVYIGYLVVANKVPSNEIVGVFTNGGTGQILDCVLATGASLSRVCFNLK